MLAAAASQVSLGAIHIVRSLITTLATAQTLRAPFSTIPFSQDPDFVPRGDVLDQLFEACSHPAARVALVGLGGVGYARKLSRSRAR